MTFTGKANKGDSLIVKAAGVEGPAIRVSADHAMPSRERLRGRVGTRQVIDVCSRAWNQRVDPVRQRIQLWRPVRRFVHRDRGSRATRRLRLGKVHGGLKVGSANNGVDVLRHRTRIDDGIETSALQERLAEDEVP